MVKASRKKQEDYLKAVNQLSATEWVEKGIPKKFRQLSRIY
jgi:hypothetical protein